MDLLPYHLLAEAAQIEFVQQKLVYYDSLDQKSLVSTVSTKNKNRYISTILAKFWHVTTFTTEFWYAQLSGIKFDLFRQFRPKK